MMPWAIVSAVLVVVISLVGLDREASTHAALIAARAMSGAAGDASEDGLDGLVNPHSDMIFRATGTTSCRDCHGSVKGSMGRSRILDNAAVRGLIAKGKGAHGPGRFADCFRCHSGGRNGVEKYSDG
jgi:hypothetical protein